MESWRVQIVLAAGMSLAPLDGAPCHRYLYIHQHAAVHKPRTCQHVAFTHTQEKTLQIKGHQRLNARDIMSTPSSPTPAGP